MGFLNSVISSIDKTFANFNGPVKSAPCLMISSTSKPTRISPSEICSGVTEAGISTNSLSQLKGARITDLPRTGE